MPTISIDEAGNALGQYCVQYSGRIHQTLKQALEFEQMFPFVSCDHSYQGQDIEVNNLLQPYQKSFTPNNNEAFGGILNILSIGKVDLSFDWDEMQKFWDKWKCNWFEASKPELEWSYPRYIMDTVIMPQIIEDINKASWAGVKTAPVVGTAGTYLQAWDGYKKSIEDQITAGTIVPLATGAFTDATIIDQIRDFCKALPLLYRYRQGIILMSKTNAQMYADAYQTKYRTREVNEKMQDQMYLRVDHFDKRIRGLNSMEGSNRIILFFPGMDSLIVGTRRGHSNYPNFRFDPQKRQVDALSEMYRFYGFETVKHLFVNDQA